MQSDDGGGDEEKAHWFRRENDWFFLGALEGDVERCEQLFAVSGNDDFARRTLVRTISAQIEGLSASAIDWARYAAAEGSQSKHRYTEAERSVLRGVVAQVNDSGDACMLPERRYLTTKVHLRFALSLVGRGAARPPKVDYGDRGWAALMASFAVRDRLMHPKGTQDLVVTDAELDEVRRGRDWFVSMYKSLQDAFQLTLCEQIMVSFPDLFKTETRPLDEGDSASSL